MPELIVSVVRLDILVLLDIRRADVAAPSHAAALEALAGRGYRIGILPVAAEGIAADPYTVDGALATLLDAGRIDRIAPETEVDCALALAFDHRLFAGSQVDGPVITAAHRIVTVERPLALANMDRRDLSHLRFVAETAMGGAVHWAPGTALARDALVSATPDWPLTPEDWSPVAPLAEPGEQRAVERARPAVGMGRVARSRPRFSFDADGGETALFSSPMVAWKLRGSPDALNIPWPQPAPVELWADDSLPFAEFLTRIDILANPDEVPEDPCPVEALMALAAGVIPYLDPAYRSTFGGAALYGKPGDLPRVAADVHGDRAFAAELRETAQSVLQTRFSAQRFVDRIAELIGAPRSDPFAPAVHARPPATVIFYSSNGIGMGHLTRQLAIAKRLPGRVQPVFLSHSQAVDTVRQFGYPVEYLPYHLKNREARAHWNAALTESLCAAFAFYRPSALVFDGNVPFIGLTAALSRFPRIARVWVRRGLWGAGRDGEALLRGDAFDLIVEPGEVAPELDDGPTSDRRAGALCVAPITILDPAEQMDRAAACAALGLDPEAVNVLIAPGSGNNFDTTRIGDMALARLAGRPGIGVALAEWQIAEQSTDTPAGICRLADYPFARLHRAFDFAIAAAGYNTFAEHVAAALPTIWVPNEHAGQDQQIVRARLARDSGLGDCIRVSEPFNLATAMDRMLDRPTRERMQRRGRAFAARASAVNGAEAAAQAVAGLCGTAIARNRPTTG